VNAIAFVVLAVSGIVMAFGKFFLLPVLGATLFGWLSLVLKTLHNFAGPLFAVSLVIVILTFVKDNLPSRDDAVWLAKGGGLFNGAHVPSHRFNAGEKILFWGGVFALGLVTVGSGLVLDQLIPMIEPTRGNMQVAHMVHVTSSVLMMALFVGHIYMGTLGVDGAYGAMRHGYVDETWAREHHEFWHDDIQAGRIPAQRSAKNSPPADAAGARA
jgi:formate dehydrogenase subunit gamma